MLAHWTCNCWQCVLCCVVNVGEDCPVFDGLYEFCQLSTGGSIGITPVQLILSMVALMSCWLKLTYCIN